MLVVCLLFVCIEFLSGDAEAAISHLHHGFHLLQTSRADDQLASMFRHLSVFPLFFGRTVSSITGLSEPANATSSTFSSLDEARGSLDILISRAVRLVSMGDPFRLAVAASPTSALLQEQQQIGLELKRWSTAMIAVAENAANTSQGRVACLMLKTRWLVSKLWASLCLNQSELVYDDHLTDFEAMMGMATQAFELQQSYITSRPKFRTTLTLCSHQVQVSRHPHGCSSVDQSHDFSERDAMGRINTVCYWSATC